MCQRRPRCDREIARRYVEMGLPRHGGGLGSCGTSMICPPHASKDNYKDPQR